MAKRKGKKLSSREQSVLEVLIKNQQDSGYAPTIREIMGQTDITSTSMVSYYLNHLVDRGLIERDEGISRGIRLTLDEHPGLPQIPIADAQNNLMSIPIMGNIAAGVPIHIPPSDFSPRDAESTVELPGWMIPPRTSTQDLFALKVEGDSMIDALVNDGDLVILRRAVDAQNGDMVAAWLPEEDSTTLKYFFREKGGIRLQPANPDHKPIHLRQPGSLEIKGRVVLVIRQVEY